ncbi:MAG: hypothetical protein HC880_18450 [Bacteroidia bacterium]|nr:hypothetical protein [Bacteroidia bacterium]
MLEQIDALVEDWPKLKKHSAWGIAGQIIARPLLGMIKAIADHIPLTQPVGYLLGEDDSLSEDSFVQNIEDWFTQQFGRGRKNS